MDGRIWLWCKYRWRLSKRRSKYVTISWILLLGVDVISMSCEYSSHQTLFFPKSFTALLHLNLVCLISILQCIKQKYKQNPDTFSEDSGVGVHFDVKNDVIRGNLHTPWWIFIGVTSKNEGSGRAALQDVVKKRKEAMMKRHMSLEAIFLALQWNFLESTWHREGGLCLQWIYREYAKVGRVPCEITK